MCSSGPRTSKRSMSGPSPTQVPIRACLRPSKRSHGARTSAPSSRNSDSSVRPMRTPPHSCIRCVSASSASYRNYSSLWPGPKFQRIIIWRSAVCARWSLRAKSVVARAAPTVRRRAWRSSVSLALGRLRDSIRSSTAWLCLPSQTL
jgi:hypothetical protein